MLQNLQLGAIVELNDGRLRQIGHVGRREGITRYFATYSDGDIAGGWDVEGITATRPAYEHLNIKRVLSRDEVARLDRQALVSPAPLNPAFNPYLPPKQLALLDELLLPFRTIKAQCDVMLRSLENAKRLSDELDHPAEAEPAPSAVIERSLESLNSLFETWYASNQAPVNAPRHYLRVGFAAGYNAALRNESGLGIRPFENAEGGQSDSIPKFQVGFVAEDLDRLNPLIRKFFEAFGEANGMKFKGIEFLPNGRAIAEYDDTAGLTEKRLGLNGWIGMNWPDIADVVETKQAPELPAIPPVKELARELHTALLVTNCRPIGKVGRQT